jgi:hypothetical protein
MIVVSRSIVWCGEEFQALLQVRASCLGAAAALYVAYAPSLSRESGLSCATPCEVGVPEALLGKETPRRGRRD